MAMVTIKELSEQIGVSKVAISTKIKQRNLSDRLVKDGNRYLLDEELVKELTALFEKRESQKTEPTEKPCVFETPTDNDIIRLLEAELKSKDEQIAKLTEVIDKMTDESREYRKMIQQNNAIIFKLTGGEESQEEEPIILEDEKTEAPTPKKRWSIFRR